MLPIDGSAVVRLMTECSLRRGLHQQPDRSAGTATTPAAVAERAELSAQHHRDVVIPVGGAEGASARVPHWWFHVLCRDHRPHYAQNHLSRAQVYRASLLDLLPEGKHQPRFESSLIGKPDFE